MYHAINANITEKNKSEIHSEKPKIIKKVEVLSNPDKK